MAAAPKPNQPAESTQSSTKPARAVSAAARADDQARRAVLQNVALWKRFDDYFSTNWQAKELRKELESAGCDWELLQEWAVWSFHPVAKDEARQKRRRGKQFRQLLQTAITGYESAVEAWRMYSEDQPRYAELVELNKKLATEARSALVEAEKCAFNADRLGRTWNTQYLVLLKRYIADKTHWADKKVLTEIAHLVAAGQGAVQEKPTSARPQPWSLTNGPQFDARGRLVDSGHEPVKLRDLIRKAIQTFEHDPCNSIFITKLLPKVLESPDHFFPKR
jgi:hypothetical protein